MHVRRSLLPNVQADPCVEVTTTDTGEYQLAALGELHLDRCITDLTTRFARVEITVSPPIINFMETVSTVPAPGTCVPPPSGTMNFFASATTPVETGVAFHIPSGVVAGVTQDRTCCLKLRAVPLPADISKFLFDHRAALMGLAKVQSLAQVHAMSAEGAAATLSEETIACVQRLAALAAAAGGRWLDILRNVLAFGP
ncbi:hypothetical protein EON66_07865, partial [archaeon]